MDTCQNVSGQFWKVIGSNTGTTLPTNVSSKTIELQLENTGMARLTVNFAHDSANLTQEARRLIAKLATAMSADSLRNARYEVQGHTDATGDASYNQSLSEMRVVSVAKELEGIHGISLSRLNPVGYGETRLLDPSLPNSGVNRRVEIHLIRN